MARILSACGVMCSDCPAFQGREKGRPHQERTAAAWLRIYGRAESPENIACGGCLSSDEEVFPTSRSCTARLCCRTRGFSNCGECDREPCAPLARAMSVWDGVPKIALTLSEEDARLYAAPYLGHRRRIDAIRAALR